MANREATLLEKTKRKCHNIRGFHSTCRNAHALKYLLRPAFVSLWENFNWELSPGNTYTLSSFWKPIGYRGINKLRGRGVSSVTSGIILTLWNVELLLG